MSKPELFHTPPMSEEEYESNTESLLDKITSKSSVRYSETENEVTVTCFEESGEVMRCRLQTMDGKEIRVGGDGPTQMILALLRADELFELELYNKLYRAAQAFNMLRMAQALQTQNTATMWARQRKMLAELMADVPPPPVDPNEATERSLAYLLKHTVELDGLPCVCPLCGLSFVLHELPKIDHVYAFVNSAYMARAAVPSKRQDSIAALNEFMAEQVQLIVVGAYFVSAGNKLTGPALEAAKSLAATITHRVKSQMRLSAIAFLYVKIPTTNIMDQFNSNNINIEPQLKKLEAALEAAREANKYEIETPHDVYDIARDVL